MKELAEEFAHDKVNGRYILLKKCLPNLHRDDTEKSIRVNWVTARELSMTIPSGVTVIGRTYCTKGSSK